MPTALRALRPEVTDVEHALLMASALTAFKSDEDRGRISALLLTATGGSMTAAGARQELDSFMDKNQKAFEARWIEAEHVEQLWGPSARLQLLRDIVLRRLSE